jgi:hypothetical protein
MFRLLCVITRRTPSTDHHLVGVLKSGGTTRITRMGKLTEGEEEKYVRDLFLARFNVSLRRLPKGSGKTADYELAVAGERAAVVEVKRLGWRPRTPERGWHVTEGEDGVRHAVRDDNAPDRVGTAIHEACKQLRNYADPKILVFVNDERLIDVGDLDEAFNGFMEYGNAQVGYVNTASMKIGQGRIRGEKNLIDLYVWVDRHQPGDPVFRATSDVGSKLAQRFFGMRLEADAR